MLYVSRTPTFPFVSFFCQCVSDFVIISATQRKTYTPAAAVFRGAVHRPEELDHTAGKASPYDDRRALDEKDEKRGEIVSDM